VRLRQPRARAARLRSVHVRTAKVPRPALPTRAPASRRDQLQSSASTSGDSWSRVRP
jgi:hypothetical protein